MPCQICKLIPLVVSVIFLKNHFVMAEAAAADIDDSIRRKRIRVSLKNEYQLAFKSPRPVLSRTGSEDRVFCSRIRSVSSSFDPDHPGAAGADPRLSRGPRGV